MTLNKTIKKLEDTQGLINAKCPSCRKESVMIYQFIWEEAQELVFSKKYDNIEHALDYRCFRCNSDISLASIKRYNYPWCYEI